MRNGKKNSRTSDEKIGKGWYPITFTVIAPTHIRLLTTWRRRRVLCRKDVVTNPKAADDSDEEIHLHEHSREHQQVPAEEPRYQYGSRTPCTENSLRAENVLFSSVVKR